MKTQHSELHRIDAVKIYLSSPDITQAEMAKKEGIDKRTFERWVAKYKDHIRYNIETDQALKGVSAYEVYNKETGKFETTRRWVKTDKDKDSIQSYIQIAIDSLYDSPKFKPKQFKGAAKENLACVLPIGDAHIGMWCPDWDLEKAEKVMCSAFHYLNDTAPSCEKCFIFNVGDYFHYHSLEGVTEKSRHVVDRSGSPMDMIDVGIKVMRYAIEAALEKHKEVHVTNVAGNHDGLLAFFLSKALKHIYENEPRIYIDDAHEYRHYARFGKNLFGVAHGDKTKDAQLGILMASEKPEDWGLVNTKWWFRGHHHHDSNVEHTGGVYVQQVRTMAAGDNYATSHGFLSGRDMKSFLFRKSGGKVREETCSPELIKELYGLG